MASNAIDLESSATPQQILETEQVEQKISRSTKPIALKMEVFAARTSGKSKRTIAKELGICENTVNAILKEGKYDSLVAAGKFGLSTAIFDSVETIAKKCKTSERSAMYVLDKMVFAEESGGRTFSANVQVNVAIPRAKVLVNNMPIEAKSLPETAVKPSK